MSGFSHGYHGQQCCSWAPTHVSDVAQHGGHTPASGLTGTSMSWAIDSCQNKVSADQYVTISRAQVKSSSWSHNFKKLTADKVLVFYWIVGSGQVNLLIRAEFRRYTNVFHCLCFMQFEIIETQNRRPDIINREPQCKVTKLTSKSWVSVNRLSNNPALFSTS